MGMGWQFLAGTAAPTSASRRQPPAVARTRPVSGSTCSGPCGGSPGATAARSSGAHREPVVEQRDLTVRGQHAAQPVRASAAIASSSSGRRRLAGRPEQPRDVDQVGEDLAVVGGRSLVVTAVGQHLHGELSGQRVRATERSSRSFPKNTASPASAFRFLIR